MRSIQGIRNLNYWEQLKSLSMYSLQRRRERYMIIYTWKILEGLVPNLLSNPIEEKPYNKRLGCRCLDRPYSRNSSSKLNTLRENSFAVTGPKLFNMMPKELRELRSKHGVTVDDFKTALDHYLTTVPDEPQLRNYTAARRADTNSLIDMCRHAAAHLDDTVDEHAVSCASGGPPGNTPRD